MKSDWLLICFTFVPKSPGTENTRSGLHGAWIESTRHEHQSKELHSRLERKYRVSQKRIAVQWGLARKQDL